jgi:hypothetical protein
MTEAELRCQEACKQLLVAEGLKAGLRWAIPTVAILLGIRYGTAYGRAKVEMCAAAGNQMD